MFPETLETGSLVLGRFSPDHVDGFDLYDLFAEENDAAGVFEYVPQEPFATPRDARDWLRDATGEWEEGSHAKYAVYVCDGYDDGEDEGDGQVGPEAGETIAGVAALSPDWDRRKASLAVILAQPYWGRGYAGECAEVLAGVAFDGLDLEVATLSYDEGNERSKRAIEKFLDRFGGQYDGVRRNATPRGDEVVDAHDYGVTREQYRATVENA